MLESWLRSKNIDESMDQPKLSVTLDGQKARIEWPVKEYELPTYDLLCTVESR